MNIYGNIRNNLKESEENGSWEDALNSGKVINVYDKSGQYTPTKFFFYNGKVYYKNKAISGGSWFEHPQLNQKQIIKHIKGLLNDKEVDYAVEVLDEKPNTLYNNDKEQTSIKLNEEPKGKHYPEGKILREPDMARAGNSVRDWYVKEYPSDDLGPEIPEELTFNDVFEALDRHQDIYELLAPADDSIVRERVFSELADIMGTDYDYVYNQWLGESARPKKKAKKKLKEAAKPKKNADVTDTVTSEELSDGVNYEFTMGGETYYAYICWASDFDFDEEVESGNIPEDANEDDWWGIYMDVFDSDGESITGGLMVTEDPGKFKISDILDLADAGSDDGMYKKIDDIPEPKPGASKKAEPKKAKVVTLDDLDTDGINIGVQRSTEEDEFGHSHLEVAAVLNFALSSDGEIDYTLYTPDGDEIDGGQLEVDEDKTWEDMLEVAKEILDFQDFEYESLFRTVDGSAEDAIEFIKGYFSESAKMKESEYEDVCGFDKGRELERLHSGDELDYDAYEVADYIDEHFDEKAETLKNGDKVLRWTTTFDGLMDDAFEKLYGIDISEYDDDYWDIEQEIRGILSYRGYETVYENNEETGANEGDLVLSTEKGKITESHKIAGLMIKEAEKGEEKEYEVEYWVDEEARDEGYGEILNITATSVEDAIAQTKKYYYREDWESIELLDDDGQVIFGIYPEDGEVNYLTESITPFNEAHSVKADANKVAKSKSFSQLLKDKGYTRFSGKSGSVNKTTVADKDDNKIVIDKDKNKVSKFDKAGKKAQLSKDEEKAIKNVKNEAEKIDFIDADLANYMLDNDIIIGAEYDHPEEYEDDHWLSLLGEALDLAKKENNAEMMGKINIAMDKINGKKLSEAEEPTVRMARNIKWSKKSNDLPKEVELPDYLASEEVKDYLAKEYGVKPRDFTLDNVRAGDSKYKESEEADEEIEIRVYDSSDDKADDNYYLGEPVHKDDLTDEFWEGVVDEYENPFYVEAIGKTSGKEYGYTYGVDEDGEFVEEAEAKVVKTLRDKEDGTRVDIVKTPSKKYLNQYYDDAKDQEHSTSTASGFNSKKEAIAMARKHRPKAK